MAALCPDTAGRQALIEEIFSILDQKHRGFISRMELAHIFEAMQAASSVSLRIPAPLRVESVTKNSEVTLADLHDFLGSLQATELSDLKWLAESIVGMEEQFKAAWQKAVQAWREKVHRLYVQDRGLQNMSNCKTSSEHFPGLFLNYSGQ